MVRNKKKRISLALSSSSCVFEGAKSTECCVDAGGVPLAHKNTYSHLRVYSTLPNVDHSVIFFLNVDHSVLHL